MRCISQGAAVRTVRCSLSNRRTHNRCNACGAAAVYTIVLHSVRNNCSVLTINELNDSYSPMCPEQHYSQCPRELSNPSYYHCQNTHRILTDTMPAATQPLMPPPSMAIAILNPSDRNSSEVGSICSKSPM